MVTFVPSALKFSADFHHPAFYNRNSGLVPLGVPNIVPVSYLKSI